MISFYQGDLGSAQQLLGSAYEIGSQVAPRSLALASFAEGLGNTLAAMHRSARGRILLESALTVRERLAPGSVSVAESLHSLGELELRSSDQTAASVSFSRAVEVIELQSARLGGSYEVDSSFRQKYHSYYLDLLDVELGEELLPEAFHTLERYRAQTFLAMLAERDIAFSADIPEELDRERRRVGVLYDRALKKLDGLNPRDHEKEIEAVREELRRLDDEAGDIEVQIRKASPRLAALRYPQPLTAEEARDALDPGTLMLAFSVGKERSAVFALSRGAELEAHVIEVGEEALRAKVEQVLTFLPETEEGGSEGSLRREQMRLALSQLFELLLGPLSQRIETSERLLVLPDGPLHELPFGALIHHAATPDGARDEYLAQWKPLHVALSATVYAELKARRRMADAGAGLGGCGDAEPPLPPPEASPRGCPGPWLKSWLAPGEPLPPALPPAPLLAAFGDPLYPQQLEALKEASVDELLSESPPGGRGLDATVRGAAERGLFDFRPLPYTRREVEGIAGLFPPGTVRTFLGAEALEDQVKTLDPRTRILHLAAHGSADEHLPSGSFIALTIPPDGPELGAEPTHDNGLLQVWEIVERLRLDADLVVLSACESGRGKELGGEGVIGLTRAFQYAGAHSVLATLWSVEDLPTAELMIRFYRHLVGGETKDEALRSAQRELIEAPIEVPDAAGRPQRFDASSPYFWAGFQVYGDWR